jgi:hypothetical protein
MIRSALFVAVTTMMLALFGLLGRLSFLAPQKRVLFSHCGASFGLYVAVFGLNLFAALLAINRKLLLKDTGRKLSHFDRQLQSLGEPGTTHPTGEVH